MHRSPIFRAKDTKDRNQARVPSPSPNDQQAAEPTWQTPHTWLPWLRTWSPGVAPPLCGLLLVFVSTVLPGSQYGQSTVPVPVLFLIYLASGACYGLALYFASSLNAWVKILLGGVVIYCLAALWLLGGLLLLSIGMVLWGALVLYYLGTSRHVVPADMLHVTTLAGRYWREIPPGQALLLPGERVFRELPNPEKQYSSPVVKVHLRDGGGDRFIAQASVAVSSRQAALDSLSKPVLSANWESELEKTIRDSLRDVLGHSGHTALDRSPSDERSRSAGEIDRRIDGQALAQTLLERLRSQVAVHGIEIEWVRIRDLFLALDPRFLKQEPPKDPTPGALPPLGSGTPSAQPPGGAGQKASESEDLDLSVQALVDLYNTVRINTITDPETIRSIAQAFHSVAHDQSRRASFPYDADEVAELLFEYAASLD
jgi:hypothetical protein